MIKMRFILNEISNNIITGKEIIKNNIGKSKSEDGTAFINPESNFELKNIPITDVDNKLNYNWYVRNDMDEDLYNINSLIKKIDSGVKLNPIVLNKKMKILDGNHRFIAYKKLKFKNIDVYVEI